MNPKYLFLIASLSSALSLRGFCQITNKPQPFSAIYAFGDCLTDTHNEPPLFPNWQGRFSNGPMWIERASTNFGLAYLASDNFAVSASTTLDVVAQVTAFRPTPNTSNALFAIWAGPVDFYSYLGWDIWTVPLVSPTNDLVWNTLISQGVNNLSNAVVYLYTQGARSFLVPNVDDVSRQPVVIKYLSQEIRSGVQQRVKQFNASLSQALAGLDQSCPDVRIVSPDSFGLFSDFIQNPPKYGMTISYPAAMEDPNLSNLSLTGPGANYVFWDEYGHPTAKAHAFIAANFMNALTNARPEKLSIVVTNNSAVLNLSKLLIGRPYMVQTSNDLATWQDAYPFTARAGTNLISMAVPASDTFFRLVWNQ